MNNIFFTSLNFSVFFYPKKEFMLKLSEVTKQVNARIVIHQLSS